MKTYVYKYLDLRVSTSRYADSQEVLDMLNKAGTEGWKFVKMHGDEWCLVVKEVDRA